MIKHDDTRSVPQVLSRQQSGRDSQQPSTSGISGALKMITPADLDPDRRAPATPYRICTARSSTDMDAVYRMTHDAFLDNGVITPQPGGRLIYAPHLDHSRATKVFVALKDDLPIATVSFTMDGPDGLLMEHEFGAELAAVRREKRRVAGVWRLVIDRPYRRDPRLVKIMLAHCVQWIVKTADTGLFVVAPRHAGLYIKLLNTTYLAERSGDFGSLIHGPTVLLRWDFERCPAKWLSRRQRERQERRRVISQVMASLPTPALVQP